HAFHDFVEFGAGAAAFFGAGGALAGELVEEVLVVELACGVGADEVGHVGAGGGFFCGGWGGGVGVVGGLGGRGVARCVVSVVFSPRALSRRSSARTLALAVRATAAASKHV